MLVWLRAFPDFVFVPVAIVVDMQQLMLERVMDGPNLKAIVRGQKTSAVLCRQPPPPLRPTG